MEMNAILNHKEMDNNTTDGHAGIFMLLGNILLYIVATLSLQEWAAIATIFAAVAAGCYNGYKFIMMLKNRKRKKREQ